MTAEEPPALASPSAAPDAPRSRGAGWSLLGLAVAVVLLGALAVLAGAGYLYASDHGFSAHVVGKQCYGPLSNQPNRVDLRTDFLHLDRSVHGVSDLACSQVEEGFYVIHHIRSKHTIVYEHSQGDCVYDSRTGTNC